MASANLSTDLLEVTAPLSPERSALLSPAARAFIAHLGVTYSSRIESLLAVRARRQTEFDRGMKPDFRGDTTAIRNGAWRVGEIPTDLLDRRVEITGPVDRKMIINALNSGAKVFMADFEDSLSPTWDNVIDGQRNLHDAVRRTITFTGPDGREYRLNPEIAVLMVRPRGLHLPEKHVLCNGKPVPGALFDFGLYLFHNARALIEHGTGPYFYLPKLESMEEAALWADVFAEAERSLGLAHGTIKATVLIETITAAFEMDEILYVLRDYGAGLNCGRWDYIFSFIKKFSADPACVLPDRGEVGMTRHFLHSYSRLLIQTCHRRGAFAMGGMAAQIPIKNDPEANAVALAKVRADKEREAGDGHDGTWVAHPGLVSVAREIFDRYFDGRNQLSRRLDDIKITAVDLLEVPPGAVTAEGVSGNAAVALEYLAVWLSGNGCVPINHLMEDAATAEISRAQLWQWVHHEVHRVDGGTVTLESVDIALEQVRQALAVGRKIPDASLAKAMKLLRRLTAEARFPEFLTLPAYAALN